MKTTGDCTALQLYEEMLRMPLGAFVSLAERERGRKVFPHEVADLKKLKAEMTLELAMEVSRDE